MDVFVATPAKCRPITGRYGHKQVPYGRRVPNVKKYHTGRKWAEAQMFLRIAQPPTKGYMVVLYPRLKKVDPPPEFARLADSVVKVATPLSTHYAMVNSHPFTFADDKVRFEGTAATVRFYKSGKMTVTSGEGAATTAVAGKTITGRGAFTVTIDNTNAATDKGKATTQAFDKAANVTVTP